MYPAQISTRLHYVLLPMVPPIFTLCVYGLGAALDWCRTALR
jgi:hypothetical protein